VLDPLPAITEEIIRRWKRAADTHESDISLIEIGGTIGDYQNALVHRGARILKVNIRRMSCLSWSLPASAGPF